MDGERVVCAHRWATLERPDEFSYRLGHRVLVVCPACAEQLASALAAWQRPAPRIAA